MLAGRGRQSLTCGLLRQALPCTALLLWQPLQRGPGPHHTMRKLLHPALTSALHPSRLTRASSTPSCRASAASAAAKHELHTMPETERCRVAASPLPSARPSNPASSRACSSSACRGRRWRELH